MTRATRALTVLLPMWGGCADWPRFAHLPADRAAPVERPDELTLLAELVEPAAPGWPDLPDVLPSATQANLGLLWEVTSLVGSLSPAGQNGEEKLPFACSPDPSTVGYSSASDIDWLHLWSDGGPLCLLLETDAPAESTWDVVLHRFDADAACVTGSFLNPRTPSGPEVVLPHEGVFLADVPLGAFALYVAGVSGLPLGTEVPYTVHVVPATVAESCADLQVTDFPDLAEVP